MTIVKKLALLLLLVIAALPEAAGTTAEQAAETGERLRRRWPAERPIDETALREDGVRRLDGRHLILYTDLAATRTVDELPAIFDQLIPALCEYFGLDPGRYETFRVEGFLIDDFDKFRRGGAVRQVPELRNGYALRCRIWLRNQSGDYYRRHLLLHEGVHAFMGYAFGAWGPPWYREGTAELLGTHRWENGRLTIGVFPESRRDFPGWGRIENVRRDRDGGGGRTPSGVFELGPEDYNENESYAWSWAFAAFCEHRPDYRDAFRKTAWQLTGRPDEVAGRFLALVAETEPDGDDLKTLRRFENDWDDFLFNIDYGYDFERTKIEYDFPGDGVRADLPKEDVGKACVRADRGWQYSGLRLERDSTYRLTAAGRFQLADRPRIWWSEPNGVTLRYHRGLPIGTLLATVLPDKDERFLTPKEAPGNGFSSPFTVGAGTVWKPPVSGALFFRINDFASELRDNRGDVRVEIRRDSGD